MKQTLECGRNEDLFWENIFLLDDIRAAEEEYFNLLAKKRKKLPEPESKKLPSTGRKYSEVLFQNKNSIRKSLDHLLHHVQTNIFKENNFECMGVMVYIEKKKSYKDQQSANTEGPCTAKQCSTLRVTRNSIQFTSYFSASKYFDGTAFQAAFESNKTEGCVCQQVTFADVFVPLEYPVSWDQQLQYISMFPNWHKWQHKTVSNSQWLSIPDMKENNPTF